MVSTTKAKVDAPVYRHAVENGKVVERDGWHDPNSRSFHQSCGCDLDTDNGAYRDVVVEYNGKTIHYYHHSPVVVKANGEIRIDACGWKTTTTKDRINQNLPSSYFVKQRDFEWFVETPNGEKQFESGMVIQP